MNNNIDQLKTEVDDIKKSLNELKNNVTLSESEKKNQAEALKTQADTTKQKIENEIKALEAATDDESKKKKEEAETLLKSFTDIMSLYNSILNPSTAPASTPAQPKSEDKNAFVKAKDWVWEQWDDVRDKEKWKNETWSNILRTAWFVATWAWAIAIAYKWIKKLWKWAFSDDDEKEESEKSDSKKEKKWFWDRWYWKALKWTGIWTWIYYVAHWLKTGRWSLSDFFNRAGDKPDATSTSQDQVQWVVELQEKDPEKFEKYKWLWDNVDKQFNHFMDKEIKSWWWGMSIADWYQKYVDKSKFKTLDDFKAVVPLCIDNQFDNVSKFMSESWYYDYLRDKDITEFKSIIAKEIWNWSSVLLSSLSTFLFWLTSFQQYKWNNIWESIKSWLDWWSPTERIEELQLFFRQYAKILNYIQDKWYQLKRKIAIRMFELDKDGKGITAKFSTVDDALNDENWVKENIETNQIYINFMQWKLSNAIDVMKAENIFDDKQSETMEKIKIEKDKERAEILNEKDWEDTLFRLDKNKSNMNDESYKEWKESAGKVYNDIEENFDKDWWYLHCSATYTLFNMDDKNKFEFMEESGLNVMKTMIRNKIKEYQWKFIDKTITEKEIEEYNKLINGYFAMKKEIYLAAEVIQSMKCNDGDWLSRLWATSSALIGDFMTLTKDSFKDLTWWHEFIWWLEATIPLYALWSVVSAAGGVMEEWACKTFFKTWWRRIKNMTVIWVTPNMLRRTNHISIMPDRLLRLRYDIPNWDNLLLQDLIEWNISGEQARRLVTSKHSKWVHQRKSYNSLGDFVIDIWWITDSATLSGQDILKLFNIKTEIKEWETLVKHEISLWKNPVLRKYIFWEPEIKKSPWQTIKWWVNWYRKKTYDLWGVKTNLKRIWLDMFFLWEWKNEAIFVKLTEKQKYLVWNLLEMWKFKSESEIKDFIKMVTENYNEAGLDLEKLSLEDIKKLITELWKNTSELWDITKVTSKIDNIKLLTSERLNQPIFGKINNTIEKLKLDLGDPNAKEIKQLENFKKEIESMPEDEFKKMNNLIELFERGEEQKNLSKVIDEITKLKKIMDKKTLKVWESSKIKIEEIIKNLDAESLRNAAKYHSDIKKELEEIADIFGRIDVKKIPKVLWSADDILRWVKILVKFLKAA